MRFDEQAIATNGIELYVATAGAGPAAVLLHGWPHSWRVWQPVAERLVDRGYRVIAPNLRGIGGSTQAAGGYDIATLAQDVAGVLDALEVDDALVAGLDAGAPIALMLALDAPQRVRRLALSESLIGDLPGAEAFLARGAPWWFGFHAVPGLAETVIDGHERDYLGWFFDHDGNQGRNITADLREAFVAAYRGHTALRGGFELYRAMPSNAAQIRDKRDRGLSVPVMTLVGGVVGDAITRQLRNLSDDVHEVRVPNAGHLVPLDAPAFVTDALVAFDRSNTTQ